MAQNSEQIEARLAAYIDGELDDAERAEIEKHLEANPQHKALIEELTGQRDLLRALPREKAPPEIAETIHQQLERSVLLGGGAEAGDAPILRISPWPHRGAIAAIVLLTAGLGFMVYKVLPSNKPPAEFAVAPKENASTTAPLAVEEKSDTRLADGLKQGEDRTATSTVDTPAVAGKVGAAPETADADRAREMKVAMADKGGDEKVAAASPESTSPGLAPAATPASTPPSELSINTNAPAPTTPAPITPAPATEDQSKAGAALNGGLAMVPSAASNSAAASNPPLAKAIFNNEAANKVSGIDAKTLAGAMPSGAGSVCLVVTSQDPSATAEQVRMYLSNNSILWEAASPPIQFTQNEYVAMSRMRSQEVELKRNGELAKAMPRDDERVGGGFGGGGAGGYANRGYAMKDVSPARRAEAEAIAKQADELAAKKLESSTFAQTANPATKPASIDATQTQANAAAVSGAAAPATQPADQPAGQSAGQPAGQVQAFGGERVETSAYFCRNVTPQQAQDLQGVLASRPGQSAQVIGPTQSLDFGDANAQANAAGPIDSAAQNAAPTTAPSTQPVVALGAAESDQANVTGQQALTLQQQLQQPADKQAQGNFDLQQPPPAQSQQAQVQQRQIAEPGLVDLLIVVRKESPTTQPAAGETAPQSAPPASNAP